jgi:succinyl-CoA synthetase alpha subunit
MGHAGAIVYGNYGSAESKISSFSRVNIPVAKRPPKFQSILVKLMK